MEMKSEKKVYTVSEVKEMLGIGRNQAYQLCDGEKFPVCRVGTKILIPIKTFEEWLYGKEEIKAG